MCRDNRNTKPGFIHLTAMTETLGLASKQSKMRLKSMDVPEQKLGREWQLSAAVNIENKGLARMFKPFAINYDRQESWLGRKNFGSHQSAVPSTPPLAKTAYLGRYNDLECFVAFAEFVQH